MTAAAGLSVVARAAKSAGSIAISRWPKRNALMTAGDDSASLCAASITVVSVEHMDWPDGCLGVHLPDTMCTQVIVPGYRVVLEANGQRYIYHTNANGSQVILAEPRLR